MNNYVECDRKKPKAYNGNANKAEQSGHLVEIMRKKFSAKTADKNWVPCALKNSARKMEVEAKIGGADVWRNLKRVLSTTSEKKISSY